MAIIAFIHASATRTPGNAGIWERLIRWKRPSAMSARYSFSSGTDLLDMKAQIEKSPADQSDGNIFNLEKYFSRLLEPPQPQNEPAIAEHEERDRAMPLFAYFSSLVGSNLERSPFALA
jgi:hypothetical protein